MRALLIEFDGATGRRPAGIEANDPKLQCYGWQNLGVSPCLEIRVIEDDREISQYLGREVEGLTVLHNDQQIQAAIDALPSACSVKEQALFRSHLDQRGIILDDVPGKDSNEQLQYLLGIGIKGIGESKRPRLKEIYPQATT